MVRIFDPFSVRFRLAVKLALWLATVTLLVFFLFGFLILQVQQRHFESEVLREAEGFGELIRQGTRHAMLHNDRETLTQLILDLSGDSRVRNLRITDPKGLVRYSADANEIGDTIDVTGEATRFTDAPGSGRTLVSTNPILNQPDCSSAACHAHPPGQPSLGVIQTGLSLSDLDARQAQLRRRVTWMSALAALLVCSAGVVFVWTSVHRPVSELAEGTRRLSEGDLDYRLPIRSRDELGLLAASFNRMAAELGSAREELSDWAGTLRDRVREKSEELERLNASLINNERMVTLGKVAAMVAHEVNSPLFAMLTYAKLARKQLAAADMDDSAREEIAKHVELIEQESMRCGGITRELLQLARMRPAGPEGRTELADLKTLAERALRLVRHQFERQSIQVRAAFADDLPTVECDPGEIEQAFLALLVNAADAMPNGGHLEVATSRNGTSDGCSVRLRDTGTGIAPEHLPHIFEAFFTTKEERHRTGLGLPIAKSIVERHGGSITVDSAPNRGTEFTVTLPFRRGGKSQGDKQC